MAYQRYKGSPDVFEEGTGRYISATEAQKTPDFFSQVKDIATPRPDIKGEEDFARLSGTNITMQPISPTTPQLGPQGVDTTQPSPQTIQAQPFTQPEAPQPSKFQRGFQQANQEAFPQQSC